MHRSTGVTLRVVAVAAALALAGCSAEVSGTATAATHLATSNSGSAQINGGSSAPASESATTGATPLDGASVHWLDTFCTGFADVASYAGPDTAGQSDAEIVQQIVHAYHEMSAAARHAESSLRSLPQPTFPGRQRIVPAALDWFGAVTTVYGQGAATISGTTFSSLGELSAAVNHVESGMNGANTRFGDAIGQVDPSVTDAMRTLPECAALLHSGG